jgi:mono/diheme cytochrome c family protein
MLKNLLIVSFAILGLYSCTSEGENTGIEYAPDMYVSKGYEPYSQIRHMDFSATGMTMRLPVAGTIARGQMDYIYNYPDSPEGYEASAANLNPIAKDELNLLEGKRLYNIYCWSCHGKEGKNDGPVISVGKFAKPPFAAYTDPYIQTLADGKIFHVITYGKNMMGSHAHMLNPKERWQVVGYVKKLSLGSSATTTTDSTAVAATDSTKIK